MARGDENACGHIGAGPLRALLNDYAKHIGKQFLVDIEKSSKLRYAFSRAAMFGNYTGDLEFDEQLKEIYIRFNLRDLGPK